ncbi:hypothetical protein [Ruminococcus sp.]|uniref:hypothetical protein n=1 Tax=Ruminococcus sp. TaxID=41978 RepID=UPI001B76FE38|nr:hypothetical protein [Ruminococcus sp.]MBP5433132.1 hypothetical protein [Ruminococcus sp.]
MLLSFIIDWITDYCNTPEMSLTFSQRALFALALTIIAAVPAVIAVIVAAIQVIIENMKKGR